MRREIVEAHGAGYVPTPPNRQVIPVAKERGETVADGSKIRIGQVLHPSPASPKANRGDWTKTATKELIQLGVWK